PATSRAAATMTIRLLMIALPAAVGLVERAYCGVANASSAAVSSPSPDLIGGLTGRSSNHCTAGRNRKRDQLKLLWLLDAQLSRSMKPEGSCDSANFMGCEIDFAAHDKPIDS